jgi:hypothetical protein
VQETYQLDRASASPWLRARCAGHGCAAHAQLASGVCELPTAQQERRSVSYCDAACRIDCITTIAFHQVLAASLCASGRLCTQLCKRWCIEPACGTSIQLGGCSAAPSFNAATQTPHCSKQIELFSWAVLTCDTTVSACGSRNEHCRRTSRLITDTRS